MSAIEERKNNYKSLFLPENRGNSSPLGIFIEIIFLPKHKDFNISGGISYSDDKYDCVLFIITLDIWISLVEYYLVERVKFFFYIPN